MKYQIDAKNYGTYDVAVCGGGTAGVFAAIAAARQGARTILIERSFVVGGMLTMGDAGITKFTEHCRDVDVYKKEVLDVLKTEKRKDVQVVGGIPLEYVERMVKDGVALGTGGTAGSYIFTDRCAAQRYLINMLEESNVEILYDTRVCMTLKDGNKVIGVVVHNKDGFCQIDASVVIDATGDADVAAMAGAECNCGATEADVKEGGANKVGEMQGSGVMYRVRGLDFDALFDYLEKNPEFFVQHEFGVMSLKNVIESHRNGEMCVFRVLVKMPSGVLRPTQVYNLPAKGEAILLGPGASCSIKDFNGLDARSISAGQNSVCKTVYEFINMLNKSVPGFENVELIHVPDIGIRETRHVIGDYMLTGIDVLSGRNFEDSIGCGGHPVDIHPLPPEVEHMDMNHWRFHMPYRMLLPKGLENLLVAGRCVSATRIASGAIRPTAQCMVMGEAAGTAAALSLKDGVSVRNIDIKKLQNVLTENGAII